MVSKKKIKDISADFREMSLVQQQNFLGHLYDLSKENKDVFDIWLKKDESLVLDRLILAVEKETFNRIGKFRKLRVSKLNEIVKKSKKYPITQMASVDLYNVLWEGVLCFVVKTDYVPDRYRQNCLNYMQAYFDSLKNIAENSERLDREAIFRKKIEKYLPMDLYFVGLRLFYNEKWGS